VEQAVTVYLPRELLQIGNAGRRTTTVFGRGCPSKRAVDARFIAPDAAHRRFFESVFYRSQS
jgi:hypothetical protein